MKFWDRHQTEPVSMSTTSIVVIQEAEALEMTWRFVQKDVKKLLERRNYLRALSKVSWGSKSTLEKLQEAEIELQKLMTMLRALDRVRLTARREMENGNG